MDESQVKAVIQKTLETMLPDLVSRVVEILNKEKTKKWKELTEADLDQLIDERTTESFCRAAAHPSLTQEQIKRLVDITLSSFSIEKQKIVFIKLVKAHKLDPETKERISQVGVDMNDYDKLANCLVLLATSPIKSRRQKARQKIFESLYIFDNPYHRTFQLFCEEMIKDLKRLPDCHPYCYHYVNVLGEDDVSKLIKYTRSENYDTRIIAQKKIEIIIKHQLRLSPGLIKCLEYYDSQDRRGLSVILKELKREREANH